MQSSTAPSGGSGSLSAPGSAAIFSATRVSCCLIERSIKQQLTRVAEKIAAEPGAERDPEPPLGAVEDCIGHPTAVGATEDQLLPAQARLLSRRKRGGELHQLMVQEGRPSL